MKISELVERFGGTLEGDGSAEVSGVGGVEFAGPQDVTFAVDDRMLASAEASAACGVIVPGEARSSPAKPLIRCDSPNRYAAELLSFFHPVPAARPGIHPTAVVDDTAEIAPSAEIGPQVVIGGGCRIGERVRLMASVSVADDCSIGDDTVIHPNTTLYAHTRIGTGVLIHAGVVIGADGFGFFPDAGGLRKWPHVGNVVIEDGVEIGANACIDRAKFGTTLIERGAKIDNLVQVAHNCRVGPGAILAGQVGLSGSVVLEAGVVCGGQVGIADHITIGGGARLAAQTGVISHISAGTAHMGSPSMPRQDALRAHAMLKLLAKHASAVRRLVRKAGGGPSE